MFDVIYRSFELTLEELAEIHLLHNEFETECARLKITYSDSEYSKLWSDMANKVSAIRDKAHTRSLKYFASHVDELIKALQGEAEYCAFHMYSLEHIRNVPQSIDYWKNDAIRAISIYSELLPPEAQSDLLEFVDYAFTNREKIYRDFQKAIQRGQKGRTGYEKLLHGPGTDNGLRASKRRMKRSQKITAEGLEIIGEQVIDETHIALSNFDSLKLTDSARKLFHILAIKLTKQVPYLATAEQIIKGRRVSLSLDEYMSLCGLTDRKEARKKLISSLEVLYNLSMKWPEKSKIIDPQTGRRKYRIVPWDIRVLEGKYGEAIITDNKIEVDFSVKIAEYLSQAYIMQINLQVLAIDTNKFRHAYSLAIKLYSHYSQNAGKYKHVRISVESLLKACPEMPRPEEVKSRHYSQQIIDPFEENMNALQEAGNIEEWHYCNSGGEALTDEQLRDYDFNDWLHWLVEYTLPADCPEPPKPKTHKRRKDTKQKAIALPAKSE